jgi:hypothetical protein
MIDPMRDALHYCMQRQHLRRTLVIALAVGTVLTAVNQLDVILRGEASSSVPLKIAANFLVPFCVSNLGLLSGRPRPGPTQQRDGKPIAAHGPPRP